MGNWGTCSLLCSTCQWKTPVLHFTVVHPSPNFGSEWFSDPPSFFFFLFVVRVCIIFVKYTSSVAADRCFILYILFRWGRGLTTYNMLLGVYTIPSGIALLLFFPFLFCFSIKFSIVSKSEVKLFNVMPFCVSFGYTNFSPLFQIV